MHARPHCEERIQSIRQQCLYDGDGSASQLSPGLNGIFYLCFDAWLGSDIGHRVNHMTAKVLDRLLAIYGFSVDRRDRFFTYRFLWSALLGNLFGTQGYSFDTIFGALKSLASHLRRDFATTANTLPSIAYLAPIVTMLALYGPISNKAEVTKIYARHILT